MTNLRKWLEDAVSEYGEPLEAVVVGRHADRKYNDHQVYEDENVVLSPEAALIKLDQEFDNGFGGENCFPFIAWTASRVFFVSEYDGSTGLSWVPRNPVAIEPEFSGQS